MDIITTTLWTADFLCWLTVSSALSVVDFVVVPVFLAVLQILHLTSQVSLTVMSTLFDVISSMLVTFLTFLAQMTPRVVEIFVHILEYLLNVFVLLVKSVSQFVFYLYTSAVDRDWMFVLELVKSTLLICAEFVLTCIFMLFSAVKFAVSGTFTILIQLASVTWYAVAYVTDVIAVSVVGICGKLSQVVMMPVTSQTKTAPRDDPNTHTVDLTTKVLIFTVLGIVLCVTAFLYYRCKRFKRRAYEHVRVSERMKRDVGTRAPHKRQRMDNDQLETEEHGKNWGVKHNTIRRRKSSSHSLEDVDIELKMRSLEMELAKEKDAKQCVVCLDNPRKLMIKPCNHYCLCENCWKQLTKCPICTERIVKVETIFNV